MWWNNNHIHISLIMYDSHEQVDIIENKHTTCRKNYKTREKVMIFLFLHSSFRGGEGGGEDD